MFSNWLLPRICICCGFDSGSYSIDLCAFCKASLPWLHDCCYRCGVKLSKYSEATLCEKCQDTPPPFNRVCALFAYKPPLIKLIGGLKWGRQLQTGKVMGQLLAESIQNRWYLNKALPEIIIPVPLHAKRHRKRGYNQAIEIAIPIAHALQIPLRIDICERLINTKPQALLDRSVRTTNLSAAFKLHSRALENYKHIAVVDDVITTGSTVRAISSILGVSGVEVIDIWCVCRA